MSRVKFPATFYFRTTADQKEAVEAFRMKLEAVDGEPRSEAYALRVLLWEALNNTKTTKRKSKKNGR